jgi:hypothetical protein
VLDGGVRRVFYGLIEEDLDTFCHVFEGRLLEAEGLVMSYFIE